MTKGELKLEVCHIKNDVIIDIFSNIVITN